ncbi:nucleoside recognition domain-containing protein [Clostridium minihomine]|uniref:nucleoside recognition domain-containing protein n=1 Tax=Clostridium minihomine TaxID=2045012 RepID=UPI000C793092|nr:nucleoside recognition domain-containing protein [Clostridium minihomine]
MHSNKIVSAVFAAAFGAGLLFLPAVSAQGAMTGLQYCLLILVPSLFPFMALSTYLVKSGISDSLGKALGPITRLLFRLPGCAAATILMSMVGGFPVGARGIAALHQQGSITDREAGRMISFCVNAGPAFVITVVGVGMLGNISAGVVLLCAQLAASVLLGIILGFLDKTPVFSTAVPQAKKSQSPLIDSTVDAARGTMNLCAFVILFSVLIALLRETGIAGVLAHFLLRFGLPPAVCGSAISVLMEVTGGCFDIAVLGGSGVLFAFAMGWGGLCVHFQVLSSVTKIPFSRSRFFFHQLIKGCFSAFFAIVLFQFFPQAAPVFQNTSEALSGKLSGSPAAAGALVALCIVLLCSVGAEKLEFKKKSCYNKNKSNAFNG